MKFGMPVGLSVWCFLCDKVFEEKLWYYRLVNLKIMFFSSESVRYDLVLFSHEHPNYALNKEILNSLKIVLLPTPTMGVIRWSVKINFKYNILQGCVWIYNKTKTNKNGRYVYTSSQQTMPPVIFTIIPWRERTKTVLDRYALLDLMLLWYFTV